MDLTSLVDGFRLMPSTISGHSQKVDDMLRNQWTVCSGIGGRHVPELVVDFPRIMHSSYGYNQNHPRNSQNADKSGYELLYYAEQFRDLSSVMSKKYVEQDYKSISSILVECVKIADKVSELEVSNNYSNAKSYAKDWMYSDAYWYYLAITDGNKDNMRIAFNDSMEYFTLFLNEMKRLGHDFD